MSMQESIRKIRQTLEEELEQNPKCGNMFCSTCGGYGKEISRNLSPDIVLEINNAMKSMTLSEFKSFGMWQDFLERIDKAGFISVYAREGDRLDLTDTEAVDYFLMNARKTHKLGDSNFSLRYDNILKHGISLATSEHHPSLVETLVIILGERTKRFPELLDIAISLGREDNQMGRVLYNCFRQTLPEVRGYVGDGSAGYPYY